MENKLLEMLYKESDETEVSYAKGIPAERLLHIMRYARDLGAFEWTLLNEVAKGNTYENIAVMLGIDRTNIGRKVKKLCADLHIITTI